MIIVIILLVMTIENDDYYSSHQTRTKVSDMVIFIHVLF